MFSACALRVEGLTEVIAIAAGGGYGQCLALRNDGSVWDTQGLAAWPIPDLADVVAIAAGFSHSVAVKSDGTAWAWGENGGVGTLGDGNEDGYTDKPVQVVW